MLDLCVQPPALAATGKGEKAHTVLYSLLAQCQCGCEAKARREHPQTKGGDERDEVESTGVSVVGVIDFEAAECALCSLRLLLALPCIPPPSTLHHDSKRHRQGNAIVALTKGIAC